MKRKTLLKSFLLLALIFTFSSFAQASEVTGNLSSTTISEEQDEGESSGSSSSGSSGTRTTNSGTLESENIVNPISVGPILETPIFATNSNGTFSSDGTAFGPGGGSLALEDSVLAPTIVTPATSSGLVATALGGFGDFSATSWFWIVFLLLLLIAFIVYVYRRPSDKNKPARV